MAELPSFFRKPFGAGWALVGDAGHHKDPLVGRGISDAWRDSQLLADAVIAGWGEPAHLHSRLVEYQRVRDRVSIGLTRVNAELARLNRPLPEMRELWLQLGDAERAGEETITGAHA